MRLRLNSLTSCSAMRRRYPLELGRLAGTRANDTGKRTRRCAVRYVEAGGVRVSAIGLGCWQFGSTDWGYGKEYGDTVAVELVHRALDHGVNLIDTAEIYARGVSEAIVGRARSKGGATTAFLATKVVPTSPTATGSRSTAGYRRMRLGVDVDRPVPAPLAEPGLPDRVADGRHAPRCSTTGSSATSA